MLSLVKAEENDESYLISDDSCNSSTETPIPNRRMVCIVDGCKSKGIQLNYDYYRLTRRRFIPWMKAIGKRLETIDTPDYQSYICQTHFNVSQYNGQDLKNNAIPTLNLPSGLCERSNYFNATWIEELHKEFDRIDAIIEVENNVCIEEVPSLNNCYSQLLLRHDLFPNKKELSWRLKLLGIDFNEDESLEENNDIKVDFALEQSEAEYPSTQHSFEEVFIKSEPCEKEFINESSFIEEPLSNTPIEPEFEKHTTNSAIETVFIKEEQNLEDMLAEEANCEDAYSNEDNILAIETCNSGISGIHKSDRNVVTKSVHENISVQHREDIDAKIKNLIMNIYYPFRLMGKIPTLNHYYEKVKLLPNANITKSMLESYLTQLDIKYKAENNTVPDVEFINAEGRRSVIDLLVISELRHINNRVTYSGERPDLDDIRRELYRQINKQMDTNDVIFSNEMILHWINVSAVQCRENLCTNYPDINYFFEKFQAGGYTCSKSNIARWLKQYNIKFVEEGDQIEPQGKVVRMKKAMREALYTYNTQFYREQMTKTAGPIDKHIKNRTPRIGVAKMIADYEFYCYRSNKEPTTSDFLEILTETYGNICSKNVLNQWLDQLDVRYRSENNPHTFRDIPTLKYFCEGLKEKTHVHISKHDIRNLLKKELIVFEDEECALKENYLDDKSDTSTILTYLHSLNREYYNIDTKAEEVIRNFERIHVSLKTVPSFNSIYKELLKINKYLSVETAEIWLNRMKINYLRQTKLKTMSAKNDYRCLVPPLDYFYEKLNEKMDVVYPKSSVQKWLDILAILYYPSYSNDVMQTNVPLDVNIVKALIEFEREHETFSEISLSRIIKNVEKENYKKGRNPNLNFFFQQLKAYKLFCNTNSDHKNILKHWLNILRVEFNDTNLKDSARKHPTGSNEKIREKDINFLKENMPQTQTLDPKRNLQQEHIDILNKVPPGMKLIKLTDCPRLLIAQPNNNSDISYLELPNQTLSDSQINNDANSNFTQISNEHVPSEKTRKKRRNSYLLQPPVSDVRSANPIKHTRVEAELQKTKPIEVPLNSKNSSKSKVDTIFTPEVQLLLSEGFFKAIELEFSLKNLVPSLDYILKKLRDKGYNFETPFLIKVLVNLGITFVNDLSIESQNLLTTLQNRNSDKISNTLSDVSDKQTTLVIDNDRTTQDSSTKCLQEQNDVESVIVKDVIEIDDSDDDDSIDNIPNKKCKTIPENNSRETVIIEIEDDDDSVIINENLNLVLQTENDQNKLLNTLEEVQAEFSKKPNMPTFFDFFVKVTEQFGDQYSSEYVHEMLKKYHIQYKP